MKHARSIAVAAALLLALPLAAQQSILCTGVWAPTTSEQALVKQFGRANVVREMIYLAEGNETPGTVLFPKDETKRVEIVWKDTKQRKRPEWIRIPSGSRWTTFSGIRNGTTLAEIEKLNGRAFQLLGFDWDYGGSVGDWRGGALAKVGTPCLLQVTLDRTVPDKPTKAQQRALDATSGERELLSSSPDLRKFPVFVNEIVVAY